MIGELLLKLTNFLQRKRYFFLLFLVIITAILAWGITRLKISESIFSTLPKGKMFDEFNKIISNKSISNQIVFSLNSSPEDDPDLLREIVGNFSDSLQIAGNGYLAEIISVREDMQAELYQHTYAHFPELIDSAYYSFILQKIKPDTIRVSVQAALRRLSTPEGSFIKEFVLNDPLYITSSYFNSLSTLHNAEQLTIEDGLVFSNDKSSILITSGTLFDSGNSGKSADLYRKMEDFRAHWNQTHPRHQFSYFGTFAISAKNAIQIKKDTLLTLVISIVLILAILFAYYRKILTPLYILLPAAFGGLFALGTIGFIKPGISGISLATGAVLLGIALDYSIHFFTHLRHVRSIPETLKDICTPLITGSLTTILAYSALLFANSTVLQDFGLFAALSLSGALLFTLTLLPAILSLAKFDYSGLADSKPLFNIPDFSGKYRKQLLAFIGLATLGFLIASQDIAFDDKLENLSIHSQELKEEENKLTGIDPEHDKKLYFFSSAPTLQEASEINLRLFEKAKTLKAEGKIKSLLSTGDLLIPDSLRQERAAVWHQFWKEEQRGEKTIDHLNREAKSYGFSPEAFQQFKQWIAGSRPDHSLPSDTLLRNLGLQNLVDIQKDKTTIITTLVVDKALLNSVKAELRVLPGVQVFDRSEMAESLLSMVRDDFNYILLISASIVFIALLMLYGRIELALLSFLPMAISWIWILGFTAVADIKFNFVNVVIATFIFGLGDDFSIFMTDGLLHKYKYGKNNLGSYKSAISLSGITTIIGTGVLFFAEHPALKSIAMISVPGILFIVFISLVFQPIMFDIFVQKRVDRGRSPITMLTFIMSVIDFTWFLTGCFLIFIIFLIVFILPVPVKIKKRWINRAMSFFAKTVIYSGPHIKKRIFGKENLQLHSPTILIANHSSFLDIMLMMMIHPNAVLMVKKWVYESILFGWAIRYANYVFMEEGSDANAKQLRELANDGYSMVVFPEGTRSEDQKIHRFHKGAFYLSEQLQLSIQPILIHGAGQASPKHELLIKPGALHVKILPPIPYNDWKWGKSFQERTKNISAYFKQQFVLFKQDVETPDYLKNRIFNNYVFKGPVLEWYFRFKWELEKANYARYDREIGQRTHILDIGAGYGFLSFYLHYRNENRIITAVDYDQDKIQIAENSYDKSENLRFTYADIQRLSIGRTDVIFLNDVLHYLTEENQRQVLQRCAEALTSEGIIFIRDGITDFKDKHNKTQWTEKLSTGLFGFNKKENEFHFFSSDFIVRFARDHGLSYHMETHSDNTSNVLFILKKNN